MIRGAVVALQAATRIRPHHPCHAHFAWPWPVPDTCLRLVRVSSTCQGFCRHGCLAASEDTSRARWNVYARMKRGNRNEIPRASIAPRAAVYTGLSERSAASTSQTIRGSKKTCRVSRYREHSHPSSTYIWFGFAQIVVALLAWDFQLLQRRIVSV